MRKVTRRPGIGTVATAAGLAVAVLAGCSAQVGQDGDGDGGTVDLGDPNADPLIPIARRLTQDEVRYTVGDVLGVNLSDEQIGVIPADRPLGGFVNVVNTQTVIPDHVAGYSLVSEDVSSAYDWAGNIAAWGGCTDATEACTSIVVRELGRDLFRRPVTAEEQTEFTALATTVLEYEGTDFFMAADAVMRAMMQSPQFLYRLEDETAASVGLNSGDVKTVGGYEMASRLSYAAWASAPDDLLYTAAENGTLDTAAGVVAELARMLLDPARASRVTDRYMIDWGRLAALPDVGGLKQELTDSVVATYSQLLWQGGAGLTDVFTANQILLTPTLATNLGLTSAGEGLQTYDLSAVPGRVGLLTHPGLVAGMTNADGGAIVARGLFLQSQLFCGETPPPPTALQGAIDAFVEELPPNSSDRFIAEARLERPECGNCHGNFDPMAYGLEQFDYQGRFRQADEYGNPLSTDGWIPESMRLEGPQLDYNTMEELAEILRTESAVHLCITEQHMKHALGRTLSEETHPLIEAVYAKYNEGGGTYNAMLEAIAESDLFRMMKVE